MDFEPEEMVTLAALMRHAASFDGLTPAERREALMETGRALGLLSEDTRLVQNERAGYRDAAYVVRELSNGLDHWLERAKREVGNADLRDRATRVTGHGKRAAMLRAVEVLARWGGLVRPERLFLGWLAQHWDLRSVIDESDLVGG